MVIKKVLKNIRFYRTSTELHLQPPHIHPVDRIIDAVAVPVRVPAFLSKRVERGETPGVGVVEAGGGAIWFRPLYLNLSGIHFGALSNLVVGSEEQPSHCSAKSSLEPGIEYEEQNKQDASIPRRGVFDQGNGCGDESICHAAAKPYPQGS